MTSGVLTGIRVVEFDAIGPAPFCGMMLADHGASVVRIARPGGQPDALDAGEHDLLLRGRLAVALDLKDPAGLGHARELIRAADILVEGYRPGVMERLAAIVASRTLPEWQGAIDDPDACLSPVLSLDEAAHHPHIAARQTLRFEGDAVIAGAAPRFLPGPGGAPPPGAEHQRGDRRLAG